MNRKGLRFCVSLLGISLSMMGLCSCQSQMHLADKSDMPLKIITTTPILADLARNIVRPNAEVKSLVPNGADPHTYEPSLQDVRSIVYADAVFSNNLLLEEQGLIRTVDANLPQEVKNTRVGEEAKKYGADLIRLVEDPSLNTIWLGMRVQGEGQQFGATRDSQVRIQAVDMQGKGILSAFLTGTFGDPQPYLNSGDGFLVSDGYQADTVKLPTNAHTHMSWAFTKPGIYRLQLKGQLVNQSDIPTRPKADPCRVGVKADICELGSTELVFAVGVDPHKVPGRSGAQIINSGHMDITVDLKNSSFTLFGDRSDGKAGNAYYNPATTVIEVPNAALNQIPANPSYRFLGRPGSEIYVLAQAVLGKHVHGEIDPHYWQSVPNVKAAAEVIRDTLIARDPQHRNDYEVNTRRYQAKLDQLDKYIRSTFSTIPPAQKNLVTTHDAFGYLAHEYGLNVAGYVSANPNLEPSAADVIKLTRTLKELQVKAVFVEPTMLTHVNDLKQAASRTNVKVCRIYGDTFYQDIDTYLKLMSANAYNLKICLDPLNAPPPKFTVKSI